MTRRRFVARSFHTADFAGTYPSHEQTITGSQMISLSMRFRRFAAFLAAFLMLVVLPGCSTDDTAKWREMTETTVTFFQRGEYKEAVASAQASHVFALERFGERHPFTMSSLNQYGVSPQANRPMEGGGGGASACSRTWQGASGKASSDRFIRAWKIIPKSLSCLTVTTRPSVCNSPSSGTWRCKESVPPTRSPP